MYYEEKWIDGRLYWRNSPDGEFLPAGQDKELSRLRDLVREMREAHINTLSIARIKWGNLDPDVNTIFEQAEQSIAKADAILKESGEPVKYGCYADANSVVSGVFDGVFLDCLEEDCSQVKNGKCGGSHDCEHWRPIK